MRVIQGIIIHDAVGRPKIVLDQLREGLGTLGFGEQMKKFPEVFQKLFVHEDVELDGAGVVDALDFPASMSADETATHTYLKEFLMNANQKTLENFLIFSTGAPCLPNFGLGRIGVKFDNVSSIFASTCLQNVTFPKCFPDEGTFSSSLEAVVNTVTKSFNCV